MWEIPLRKVQKEDKINERLCFPRCKCQTIVTHTFMYGCLAAINVLLKLYVKIKIKRK
jgi:hypothetical protein